MAKPGSERLLQAWCLYFDDQRRRDQHREDEHQHDAVATYFRGIGSMIEKRQSA
jgi:hypothetical protein